MTYPGDHDVRTQGGPVQPVASQSLSMVVLKDLPRQPIRYVASFGKVKHASTLLLFVFSHHNTSGEHNDGGGSEVGSRSMARMIISNHRMQSNDNSTPPLCAYYNFS